MSIQNEVQQLPYGVKRSIARYSRRLLKEEPSIHTILLKIKQGVKKAEQITDLELYVFYHTGSEEENSRIIAESIYNGGSGEVSENCRIFDPGRNYQKARRTVLPHEASALALYFPVIHKKKEPEYMKFIEDHGTFFIKKDFLNITAINSTEMEKSDPRFYKLYIGYCFKNGYVVYNRLLNPFMTMHLERSGG